LSFWVLENKLTKRTIFNALGGLLTLDIQSAERDGYIKVN